MPSRTVIAVTTACLALLLGAGAARAHDTGFSHSSRTLYVDADATAFVLEYRIRLDPDVALLELTVMDANGDGEVNGHEQERYLLRRGAELLAGLHLTAEGASVSGDLLGVELGSGLTQLYRFRLPSTARELRLDDQNFISRAGHLRVLHAPGVAVSEIDDATRFHVDRAQLTITRSAAAAD